MHIRNMPRRLLVQTDLYLQNNWPHFPGNNEDNFNCDKKVETRQICRQIKNSYVAVYPRDTVPIDLHNL